MQNRYFFFLILTIGLIGSLTLVNAEVFGYGRTESVPINYSLIPTVNNSQYFDGYSVASLYTYYKSLLDTAYDLVYCKLTGCTMAGDINMSGNDINNAGTITANSFVGDGSGLTGITSTGDDTNNSFHVYINGSAYNNINYNITAGDVNDVIYPIEPGKKFIYGDTYT